MRGTMSNFTCETGISNDVSMQSRYCMRLEDYPGMMILPMNGIDVLSDLSIRKQCVKGGHFIPERKISVSKMRDMLLRNQCQRKLLPRLQECMDMILGRNF